MATPQFVSGLYSVAFAISSIGMGIFWLVEEVTSLQSAKSLTLLIQELNEGRISRKEDEEMIRWQYAQLNDLYARIQFYLRILEPIFWIIASTAMIIFRLRNFQPVS
jgi:hypothetical protein